MPNIKVFISSVQREFAEERQLLCRYNREDALLGRFFAPFIFEELPAIDLTAQQAYLTEAAQSDIYLGLFGEQYGYEDVSGISPTERTRFILLVTLNEWGREPPTWFLHVKRQG